MCVYTEKADVFNLGCRESLRKGWRAFYFLCNFLKLQKGNWTREGRDFGWNYLSAVMFFSRGHVSQPPQCLRSLLQNGKQESREAGLSLGPVACCRLRWRPLNSGTVHCHAGRVKKKGQKNTWRTGVGPLDTVKQ